MVNRSPAQLLSLVPGLGERAKVSRPSCPLISTHLFLHFRSVLLLCCPGFPRSCHPFLGCPTPCPRIFESRVSRLSRSPSSADYCLRPLIAGGKDAPIALPSDEEPADPTSDEPNPSLFLSDGVSSDTDLGGRAEGRTEGSQAGCE